MNAIKETVIGCLLLSLLVVVIALGIWLEVRRIHARTEYLHLTTIECMMQGGKK